MLEITYRSSYTGINVATQTLFEENFIPDFVLSRGALLRICLDAGGEWLSGTVFMHGNRT